MVFFDFTPYKFRKLNFSASYIPLPITLLNICSRYIKLKYILSRSGWVLIQNVMFNISDDLLLVMRFIHNFTL